MQSPYRILLTLIIVFAVVGCAPITPTAEPPTAEPPTAEPTIEETATPEATETPAAGFIPFDAFIAGVSSATYEDYAGKEGVNVDNPETFQEMQSYILTMYANAKQVSSFTDESGMLYFDCITIDTQPSVVLQGIQKIERVPPQAAAEDKLEEGETPGKGEYAPSPLTLGLEDPFGNSISCPDDTIPMQRITLDKLVQYPDLRAFFSKDSDGSGGLPPTPKEDTPKPDDGAASHRYAVGYQNLTNFGGNSWLNLWNPSIRGGTMSLSQQWYDAGAGSGTQTVEGGWQVLPQKYNTANAVLFIYWTADNYGSTGCYNLDCAGFVQINNHWYLGGPWTNYSSTGETQWGFEMQWKLFRGNWWLFLKGPGDYEAVGYYPTSIYNGGALATSATAIKYGGETAGSSPWPQMGSGQFADQGWQRAAYQNTIFYIPQDQDDGTGVWADLSEYEPSPDCYTIDIVPAARGGDWGTYLFFGGPGADSC